MLSRWGRQTDKLFPTRTIIAKVRPGHLYHKIYGKKVDERARNINNSEVRMRMGWTLPSALTWEVSVEGKPTSGRGRTAASTTWILRYPWCGAESTCRGHPIDIYAMCEHRNADNWLLWGRCNLYGIEIKFVLQIGDFEAHAGGIAIYLCSGQRPILRSHDFGCKRTKLFVLSVSNFTLVRFGHLF